MSRIIAASVLAAAFATAPLTAAFADRAPTAYENADIGNVLFETGYSSWGKIKWDDDGHWEVEDAIGPDGRRYDLELDDTLTIVKSDGKIGSGLFGDD